jgi:hypothetical protein
MKQFHEAFAKIKKEIEELDQKELSPEQEKMLDELKAIIEQYDFGMTAIDSMEAQAEQKRQQAKRQSRLPGVAQPPIPAIEPIV